jgi:hypothetical protein
MLRIVSDLTSRRGLAPRPETARAIGEIYSVFPTTGGIGLAETPGAGHASRALG